MKFTIDIDCTPEEARAFLGLPDVAPLQAALMNEVEERMRAALRGTDPETLLKAWMPGAQGWEQMQQFWRAMAGGMAGGTPGKGGKPGTGE